MNITSKGTDQQWRDLALCRETDPELSSPTRVAHQARPGESAPPARSAGRACPMLWPAAMSGSACWGA
jgi:hypothetical protein